MTRPVPERMPDKYHRAIYAIDLLGPDACGDRHYLRTQWQQMQVACAMPTPDDSREQHEAAVDKIVANMDDLIDRALAHEKDKERPMWQKQRDFLIGSLKRVRRAARLADPKHLHFYNDTEIFNVDMRHPVFQVAYGLWQGLRVELREAMSLTQLRPQEHEEVARLHTAIKRITWALEHADVTPLDHYTVAKSPLHLSPEQEGQILWEAVRTEIAGALALAERKVAA